MPYELNKENFEVVFTEHFSFECNVKSRLDSIIEDIKYNHDDTSDDAEYKEKIQEVLSKEFTDKDKISILETILSHWEYETCDGFDNRSIFDEDIIDDGIYMWLEEEFDFDFKEL